MGKQSVLDFKLDQGRFSFGSGAFQPVPGANGDFWRAFLDTDEIRELSVYSHAQTPVSIEEHGDTTVVTYAQLLAENGERFDIQLKVNIRKQGGALHFSADIRNDSNVRLNELQLPYICASRYACEPEDEVLYSPEVLGRRDVNPRRAIQKMHTEYMSADYKSVTWARTYPSPLSMPWIGLQSGEHYLYLGEHDPELKLIAVNAHGSSRYAPSELGLSISHYIAAQPGEQIHYGESVLALYEGDWRDGTAYYKAWADTAWYPDPHVRPEWVKEITGWQRIILKHQYGEIFFRYEDLPRLYEEGKAYGLNTLLVFGWWKGRFDNNYPELEPDPALGGAEALKEAVRKIQQAGGHVLLYSNGNLIDIKTDFYKKIGHRICARDIDGNEYRDHYQFSNDGTILRLYGYKSFVNGCHCTPEWKERLLHNGRLKDSFGVDSIFFDQLGCSVKLCFDQTHPHGVRIDREAGARLENIRAIRELLTPEKAIGTEWVCDRYAEATDYIHGCGNSCNFIPEAYPDLYLNTFPGTICSNRFIHDEREDYKDHLNYAFVSGLIFDVCIFRGRVCGIAGQPNYAAYVKKLLDIKQTYAKYFYHGTFCSLQGQALPAEIRGSGFKAADGGRIAALWNETDHDLTFPLFGREVTIAANELAVEEFID